jgi:hypothetical protein
MVSKKAPTETLAARKTATAVRDNEGKAKAGMAYNPAE